MVRGDGESRAGEASGGSMTAAKSRKAFMGNA
jgi:hypothetical protein